MSKDICVADYLLVELDKLRATDKDTGEREPWTEFFCRHFNIKYHPHGIKHGRGRPKA